MSECVHGDPYTVIPASLECIAPRVHNCNFVLRQELYEKELHALFRFFNFQMIGVLLFYLWISYISNLHCFILLLDLKKRGL